MAEVDDGKDEPEDEALRLSQFTQAQEGNFGVSEIKRLGFVRES